MNVAPYLNAASTTAAASRLVEVTHILDLHLIEAFTPIDKTRQDKTRKTRGYKTRQDKTRGYKTGQDKRMIINIEINEH